MLSENNDPSLQSAFSCANYKKGVVSLTTFEEEPVKGLWVTDLDAETGKIVKKTMPIEFIDDIVLPTNCLQNYNGKFSITQEIEKPNHIHVFGKK